MYLNLYIAVVFMSSNADFDEFDQFLKEIILSLIKEIKFNQTKINGLEWKEGNKICNEGFLWKEIELKIPHILHSFFQLLVDHLNRSGSKNIEFKGTMEGRGLLKQPIIDLFFDLITIIINKKTQKMNIDSSIIEGYLQFFIGVSGSTVLMNHARKLRINLFLVIINNIHQIKSTKKLIITSNLLLKNLLNNSYYSSKILETDKTMIIQSIMELKINDYAWYNNTLIYSYLDNSKLPSSYKAVITQIFQSIEEKIKSKKYLEVDQLILLFRRLISNIFRSQDEDLILHVRKYNYLTPSS